MFFESTYCLHSFNVKGSIFNFNVTRLWSPPLLLINLLIIHEAAEPQTINKTSFRLEAQLFQKCSKAWMKLLFLVSNQGNSSMKITFFDEVSASIIFFSCWNASIQVLGIDRSSIVLISLTAIWKLINCWESVAFAKPVNWKVILSLNTDLTK